MKKILLIGLLLSLVSPLKSNAQVGSDSGGGGTLISSGSGSSGSAPATSTFLVQTASGSLPNAQAMGALGTGLVINTTTTGVQSIYAGTTCTNQVLRVLSASGAGTCVSPTEAYLSFSDVTTLNATSSQHGFMPKLSGNAYDFTLGNGTYGHDIARGTITSSDPFIFSQTWNSGATTFSGLLLNITNTASNTNSPFFKINGGAAGSTCYFHVGVAYPGGSCIVAVTNATLNVTGEILVSSTVGSSSTTFPFYSGRMAIFTPSAKTVTLGDASGLGWTVQNTAIGSDANWGTGRTLVSGSTNSVGRILVGTTPGASPSITFAEAWTNAPSCVFLNETTGVATAASTTTTVATVTATFVSTNSVSWHCVGFR